MNNKLIHLSLKLIGIVFGFILTVSIFSLSSSAYINVRASTVDPDTDTKARIIWDSKTASSVVYNVYRAIQPINQSIPTIAISDGVDWTTLYTKTSITTFLDGESTLLTPAKTYIYKVISIITELNGTEVLDYGYAVINTSAVISPVIKSYSYDINNKVIHIDFEKVSRSAKVLEIRDSVSGSVYSANCDGLLETAKSIDFPRFSNASYVSLYAGHSDGNSAISNMSDRMSILSTADRSLITTMDDVYVYIRSNVLSDSNYFKLQKSSFDNAAWGEWADTNITADTNGVYKDLISENNSYRYRLIALENSYYKGWIDNYVVVSKVTGLTNIQYSFVYGSKIKLTWENSGIDLSAIHIEKKVDSENYQLIAKLDRTATLYIDDFPLSRDRKYSYRLSVVRIGESGKTYLGPETKVSTSKPILKLRVINDYLIELEWENKLINQASLRIERSVDNETYELLNSTADFYGKYSDTDLTLEHTYKYRIGVLGLDNFNMNYSDEVIYYNIGNISKIIEAQAVPLTSSSIKLSWTYSDVETKGFLIERRAEKDTEWEKVQECDPASLTYIDTGLLEAEKYFYKISAYIDKNVLTQAYTAKGELFSYTKPQIPLLISANRDRAGKILLGWNAVKNSQRYNIYRKKFTEDSFSLMDSVQGKYTSWLDEEAHFKNSYKYKISALIDEVESDTSQELQVNELEIPVSNILHYVQDELLYFVFNLKEGYTYPVKLEMRDEELGKWVEIDSIETGPTILIDKEPRNFSEYTYRITAPKVNTLQISKTYEIIVSENKLEAPKKIKAKAISEKTIRIEWDYVDVNADGFVIFRVSNGGLIEIGRTENTEHIFEDNGLMGNAYYKYCIFAVGEDVFSPPSKTIGVRTPVAKKIRFPIYYSWAYASVTSLDERGAIDINMKKNGKFYPDSNITRGEFISMVSRMCGFLKLSTTNYKDVTKRRWYYYDISRARQEEIISGSGDGYFKPDENITRQDVAVILSKAIQNKRKSNVEYDDNSLKKFTDSDDIANYAKSAFVFLVGEKIISGGDDGRLLPQNPTTRAEAAVLISKISKYLLRK